MRDDGGDLIGEVLHHRLDVLYALVILIKVHGRFVEVARFFFFKLEPELILP